MTDLRQAAQQALEALEYGQHSLKQVSEYQWESRGQLAMDALRAALAQQAEPDAYGYASRLAVAIWEKHYKDIAPHWKPLDDLMGVLTQIDNMTSGLTRRAQQAEPVEPVAEARYDGTLRWLEPHGVGLHRIQGPLYTAPPQRKPLPTHDQHCVDVFGYGLMAVRLVRAVERAHGIGEGA